MRKLSDVRAHYTPLYTPAELIRRHPLTTRGEETAHQARREIEQILEGKSNRMLLIVGPCSLHDAQLAKDYARRLVELQQKIHDGPLLVMRTYFEKPRTTVGWKGLINDPHINGTYDIAYGLEEARRLLVELAEIGVPAATEALDPDSIQYFSDAIAYASIGARTTEAQKFREMVSALSMPVGYKNGTHGGIKIAADAIIASNSEQAFLGPDPNTGKLGIVTGDGNPYAHIMLRGGDKPNYDQHSVRSVVELLQSKKLLDKLVIDCSHGNSNKDYRNQPIVFRDVLMQMQDNPHIIGMMLESNIHEGQRSDKARPLQYGISITDACIGWEQTEELILEAARTNRKTSK